jgi:hypothetical protein
MIRKLIIGKAHSWRWAPPADLYATVAELKIYWPAGTQTYALAKRAGDTVKTVVANSGRRQLTIECGDDGVLTTFAGGQPEPAWFTYAGQAQYPVRIARVTASNGGNPPTTPATMTVELAEPLPSNAPDAGALEWQTFTEQISSGHIPATMQRAVRWRVEYTPVFGGATLDDRYDHGTLAVIQVPFATGLTDGSLIAIAPWMANARPAGQMSWGPQIAAGLDRLVSLVVPELPADRWEDHLTGEPWHRAHALATVLGVLEWQQQQGQDRTAAIERAEQELAAEVARRLKRIEWLDDGDGTLESGESGIVREVSVRSHVTDASVCVFDEVDTPDTIYRERMGEPR